MGRPELDHNESYVSELDQPNEGKPLEISGGFNPFPEAVVIDPVLAGRRRSAAGTFDNDSLESYYKPIEAFEGSHRFDPKFEWDKQEEKRIVRKVSYSPRHTYHRSQI